MEIKDILTADSTLCAVPGSSKKKVLEHISQLANQSIPHIAPIDILTSLLCREKMGSTGIGGGIAIPHGRLAGIDKVLAVLVTTDKGIQFDAIDNKPVDIFFAILVPEDQAQGHLQTLATIAGKLNNPDVVKAIRSAQHNQALYEAIL